MACVEKGIATKSLLLQVARQPTEKKMREIVQRISQGGLTRDEARQAAEIVCRDPSSAFLNKLNTSRLCTSSP